ncbi:hypothetical protein EST38_g6120 [Candolleomyces aberdarensis]|uniref:Fungal-type protein kinase domain-containing protein n=1 Tax=Candolleomyces aberdarensis TaxID=2316362 RepID=A0A4Q2DIM1_9AGAR|nr:hypothetical protein EST38_g6120 [Candolleomyces aberdarensis]
MIKYDLDMEHEIFHRTSIRGRGTVCWPVKDPGTGERLLVKDYWMSEGRTPEYELLEKVRYTPGVCHMISHEEGRPETKDFRGDPFACKRGEFHNRKSIRVIIKCYGTSIDNFSSPEELLAALRDAIQAHKGLVATGILHRDITYNNVLIGIKGFESEDGERGIIIDLDMALGSRPIADICKDFRTSLMVTKYFADLNKEMIPAQDYLDDLESFFWLLVFLLFIYKPNGEKMAKHIFHDNIWKFENEADSHKAKVYFIETPSIIHNASLAIHPDWPASCFKLFRKFYNFVRNIRQAKESALYDLKEPGANGATPNRFSGILENVNSNYATIIGYFDAALQELLECSKKVLEESRKCSSSSEAPAFTPARKRPRTRSIRNDSPLVELSLGSRTPKRRNNDAEPELIEVPTRVKRRCLLGPSDLLQAEGSDSDGDSDF